MKAEAIHELAALADRAAKNEAANNPLLAANATVIFAGREYIRNGEKGWTLVEPLAERELPLPVTYRLSTLKGVIDYIKSNIDGTTEAKAAVHVESPSLVSVVGPPLGFKRQRPVYATASFGDIRQPFGEYQETETFLVWLRSRFVPTQDSENLIKSLSGVKDGAVKNVVDTGLAQEITVKVGVDMTDRAEVKNPVLLQPYRTFREVAQPQSEFVIRLQGGGEGLPKAALYEADGGTWKVEAVLKIVEFLRAGLGDETVILG